MPECEKVPYNYVAYCSRLFSCVLVIAGVCARVLLLVAVVFFVLLSIPFCGSVSYYYMGKIRVVGGGRLLKTKSWKNRDYYDNCSVIPKRKRVWGKDVCHMYVCNTRCVRSRFFLLFWWTVVPIFFCFSSVSVNNRYHMIRWEVINTWCRCWWWWRRDDIQVRPLSIFCMEYIYMMMAIWYEKQTQEWILLLESSLPSPPLPLSIN